MASRENQTIQIALILTVMATVALAVTTYVYWNKSETKVKEAEDALSKLDDANRKYDVMFFKTQALKRMLGADDVTKATVDDLRDSVLESDREDITALEKKFDQDMQEYGAGLEGDMNYVTIIPQLLAAVKSRNTEYTGEVDKVAEAIARRDEQAAKYTDDLQKLQQAVDAAQADRDKERTAFNKQRADFTQAQQQVAAVHKQALDRELREKKGLQDERNALVDDNRKLKNTLQTFVDEKSKAPSENFEIPDGRIAHVDYKTETVTINLGLADGLRPRVMFAVYPERELGVARDGSEIKARIEVTEVLDQHYSRAKIVQDDVRELIQPGDQIHSVAWRPGRSISFALAGDFDVDGDGESDRDLIRRLIVSHGGRIDAEVHPDGQKVGRISVKTQYLVKGDVEKVAQSKEFLAFIQEAQFYGVRQITANDLLSWIGWTNEVRAVKLGRGSNASDFQGDLKRTQGDQQNEVFRPRQPR